MEIQDNGEVEIKMGADMDVDGGTVIVKGSLVNNEKVCVLIACRLYKCRSCWMSVFSAWMYGSFITPFQD